MTDVLIRGEGLTVEAVVEVLADAGNYLVHEPYEPLQPNETALLKAYRDGIEVYEVEHIATDPVPGKQEPQVMTSWIKLTRKIGGKGDER